MSTLWTSRLFVLEKILQWELLASAQSQKEPQTLGWETLDLLHAVEVVIEDIEKIPHVLKKKDTKAGKRGAKKSGRSDCKVVRIVATTAFKSDVAERWSPNCLLKVQITHS